MTAPDGFVRLTELLKSLARQIVDQQERLDDEHARRLDALARVLKEAPAPLAVELSQLVSSDRLALGEVEIEVSCGVSSSRERQAAVGVRLVNLGFQRRYAHTSYAESAVRLSVRRLPLDTAGPPAAPTAAPTLARKEN